MQIIAALNAQGKGCSNYILLFCRRYL